MMVKNNRLLDRIYITVHTWDDVSFFLWQKFLPEKNIFTNDKNILDKDGEMGQYIDILYDMGITHCSCGGQTCYVSVDCERYRKIYNIQFYNFYKDGAGFIKPHNYPYTVVGQ